jgi:SAM-dependent methyltransferase
VSGVDYDAVAGDYAAMRRPDPRIAAMIDRALGDAQTVVNVGAGTGSYEPTDRTVTAVEPSAQMIAARPADSAPAIQGSAESLPFPDGAFDASMAILTVHHWPDQDRGFAELCRVARRRVVLTFDPDFGDVMWLIRDYFPGNAEIDRRQFRPIGEVVERLGGGTVQTVEIPHDCTDGFLCAYWRRPAAYLDPSVRASISSFQRLEPAELDRGLDRLRADLESEAFWARNADLADRGEMDFGYRLIVAGG